MPEVSQLTKISHANSKEYEYETQFFGFSPLGFVDTVYNIIINVWASVVQKSIIFKLPLETSGKKKALKKRLILLLDKGNKFTYVMNQLEQYVITYSFRIPDFLTLPEDLPNLEVNETIDEESEIKERIKELEEEVSELRLASLQLDDEIRNTEELLVLVNILEKQLGIDKAEWIEMDHN